LQSLRRGRSRLQRLDQEELAEFQGWENDLLSGGGYEGTSSGSVRRRPPLVIRNILLNAGEGQEDKGKGKSVLKRSQSTPRESNEGNSKVENGCGGVSKRARREDLEEELQAREKALVSALSANMRA